MSNQFRFSSFFFLYDSFTDRQHQLPPTNVYTHSSGWMNALKDFKGELTEFVSSRGKSVKSDRIENKKQKTKIWMGFSNVLKRETQTIFQWRQIENWRNFKRTNEINDDLIGIYTLHKISLTDSEKKIKKKITKCGTNKFKHCFWLFALHSKHRHWVSSIRHLGFIVRIQV